MSDLEELDRRVNRRLEALEERVKELSEQLNDARRELDRTNQALSSIGSNP